MAGSKRATVNDRNSWSIFKREFYKAYDLYGETSNEPRALAGLAVRFERLAGYMDQVRTAVNDGTANAPDPVELSIIQCRALSMKGVCLTDEQNDALQAISACCEDLANAGNVDNPKTKRGAPKANFRGCIVGKYAEHTTHIINNIRRELEGRTGLSAARVFAAAINLGYIKTPTYAMVNNEFGKEIDGKIRPVIGKKSFQGYLPQDEGRRRDDIFKDKETREIEAKLKL